MKKQIIYTPKAPEPIGPYSQAIKIDNTLYVSGQIALSEAQFGTLNTETHAVLQNIGYILAAAGMEFTDVVKSSIFLKNMDDFATINEIYGEYFKTEPPARETVQVARLPKDVNVEISVIAVR